MRRVSKTIKHPGLIKKGLLDVGALVGDAPGLEDDITSLTAPTRKKSCNFWFWEDEYIDN